MPAAGTQCVASDRWGCLAAGVRSVHQEIEPEMTDARSKPQLPQTDREAAGEYPPQLYHTAETVAPIPAPTRLVQAHVEQFQQLGFLSLEAVFTAQEVAAARAGLADLVMGRVSGFDGIQFEAWAAAQLEQLDLAQREVAVRKLMHFTDHESRLNAMAHHPALLALIEPLLGGRTPHLFQDMALLKPPQGREKPWHQDKAYFDIDVDEHVVGVWIALDDASVENGCMHLIPASHRDGPVVHFRRRDWQICDSDILGRRIVATPLAPGGVLLFDGLLHHGTPANHTAQRRRALQFHYCAVDARWIDTASRLEHFGSEGKDVTC